METRVGTVQKPVVETSSSTSQFDVELIDLTKRYGSITAVNGIRLQVHSGEFLTLLGPSGSGKTTVLRIVGGFETITSGSVFIKGRRMTDDPPHRRDTSMVFQDYALFPHKTVGANIEFGLKMRGVPVGDRRRLVQEVLQLVNLPGVSERRPHQLSGGQRQRVALARSLVIEPSVLLLDEPLGALDAQIRKQMQIELKSLQRRLGLTFVYVTHDQEEAMVISDRIAIMRDGVIEQIGVPDEVYESPISTFVASFLGECNLLRGTVTEAREGHVTVRCESLGTLLAVRALLPEGINPGSLVSVAIRPERIHLGGLPDVGANSFPARVSQALFAGTMTRYTLQLAETTIVASTLGSQRHAVGEFVQAWWQGADTIIIP